MDTRATLLCIDSDLAFAASLRSHLGSAGFQVIHADDGLKGLRALYTQRPDLVLLETSLPDLDGWQVCGRIRQVCTTPIVMISGLADEDDKVRGLSLGADDYVVKPVRLGELSARIDAILRRVHKDSSANPRPVVVDEGLVIDVDNWYVEQNGTPVELTSTETRMLVYLAANAGRILTHEQILERVWGHDDATMDRYVKLYIWKLRRKIEPDPHNPRYILTERGIGYRFRQA